MRRGSDALVPHLKMAGKELFLRVHNALQHVYTFRSTKALVPAAFDSW
ncbi:MAG: hypothetical protein IPK82_20940 [Polyangiaceae bacterium]|nr:hypothetical protein [Polyangiaceae bacterium]